jgi:hypothetical protein
MRTVAAILICCVLACGCKFGTAIGPVGGPGGECRVEIPADYRVVYTRIVTSAKAKRLRDNVVAGGTGVQSTIDEAEGTATVGVWASYGTGHYHVVAYVRELEPGLTQLRVTYALSSWKSAAQQVVKWAQGR